MKTIPGGLYSTTTLDFEDRMLTAAQMHFNFTIGVIPYGQPALITSIRVTIADVNGKNMELGP